MTVLLELIRIEKQHTARAVKILIDSFGDTSFFQHVFPNERTRHLVLPVIFEAMAGRYIAHGWAFTASPNMESIMLFRSLNKQLNLFDMLKMLRIIKVLLYVPLYKTWKRAQDFQPIWQKSNEFFKKNKKMIRLDMIAVDPHSQGRGHMSRIMRPLLEYTERVNSFCFLETENSDNVPIYKHFGFRLIHAGEIKNTAVHYFFMVYDPLGIFID
jgi:GNAT superfamily N-acetyltransferase